MAAEVTRNAAHAIRAKSGRRMMSLGEFFEGKGVLETWFFYPKYYSVNFHYKL